MIGVRSRSGRLYWPSERSRPIWNRLVKLPKSILTGLILLLLFLVYFLLGRDRTTQIPVSLKALKGDHPVVELVAEARASFLRRSGRQSQSLSNAVKQYRKRYGISPPPHFDIWYEFVKTNGVTLIDEYDDIFEQLRPFWGISPSAIRRQVAGAILAENSIFGVRLRSGEIITDRYAEHEEDEWRGKAIKTAMEPFTKFLLDMDIAFNKFDEARVILPHDQLIQLLNRASQHHYNHSPRLSTWSSSPIDLDIGPDNQFDRFSFIESTHPFTWPVSTISCPPNSPARILNFDMLNGLDVDKLYTSKPFNLVRNRTAVSDICNQPSLRGVHGMFNSPNRWSVTHNPIPIFSSSKPSTFQDVLYPAPWNLENYYNVYDPAEDMPWNEKRDALYWLGSTSGGWSQNGSWHWQHRQKFVESIEQPGRAYILGKASSGRRTPQEVAREDYRAWYDVHFYVIDFCSDEDCEAQEAFFNVKSPEHYKVGWGYKYLLDMDGHGQSGRFYTLLRSGSLTLKLALYREWHESRLVPWVHYVPLNFHETDHLELLRFFKDEVDGQNLARDIADESAEWAEKSLRYVDMQAWIFRLLLEYARLIDDARDEMGFSI